jgi:GntR family transcriptional regulator
MARRLRVNPATVAQAYRELAREGFVESRHGTGTFVTRVDASLRLAERGSKARELVRTLLQDAARLGLTADEIGRALESEVGSGAAGRVSQASAREVEKGAGDPIGQASGPKVGEGTDDGTSRASQTNVEKGTDDERD